MFVTIQTKVKKYLYYLISIAMLKRQVIFKAWKYISNHDILQSKLCFKFYNAVFLSCHWLSKFEYVYLSLDLNTHRPVCFYLNPRIENNNQPFLCGTHMRKTVFFTAIKSFYFCLFGKKSSTEWQNNQITIKYQIYREVKITRFFQTVLNLHLIIPLSKNS